MKAVGAGELHVVETFEANALAVEINGGDGEGAYASIAGIVFSHAPGAFVFVAGLIDIMQFAIVEKIKTAAGKYGIVTAAADTATIDIVQFPGAAFNAVFVWFQKILAAACNQK